MQTAELLCSSPRACHAPRLARASCLGTEPWMGNQMWNVPKQVWNLLLEPWGFPPARSSSRASLAKQHSIYLALDLFSSSTLLFVSLVGMRMLNPHHHLHYTTSLQSVTGDCVKSAIKDWYWLIQLWCCSSVLSDCTELRQAAWPASSAPFLLSDHWSIIFILPSRLTGIQCGDVPTPTLTRGLQTRTFLGCWKNLLRYSKKDAKKSCCWNLFTQGTKLNFETGVGETT